MKASFLLKRLTIILIVLMALTIYMSALILSTENICLGNNNPTVFVGGNVVALEIDDLEYNKENTELVKTSIYNSGTITFYNPKTNSFAALGHALYSSLSSNLLDVKDGKCYSANISEIYASCENQIGSIFVSSDSNNCLGTITSNSEIGLTGELEDFSFEGLFKLQVASKYELQEGKAIIYTDLDGNGLQEYSISIENININSSDEKNFSIKITDENLLELTGGIVQGMSGTPIVQNGKLVGAINYVYNSDPLRGYAVFAENML